MKCKDCKYWVRFLNEPNYPIGQCRRYPPKKAPPRSGGFFGVPDECGIGELTTFPHTEENEWCGECKKKE